MGFEFYVEDDVRSALIITFVMPTDPKFNFQSFYDTLAAGGMVIYPGKTAEGDSFRFGTIGRLFPHDCELLVAAVRAACDQMGVQLPLNQGRSSTQTSSTSAEA